ncbi:MULTISPECIES: cell division protein FtsL [Legionella]|uniref:Cell division protein FtsL n=1 Tax=Legionella septentrionalis TaxID=2498109 RepID=A0A433JKJ6_9GAMM|nr:MULTISPECIES: cell division protein FtsL [Legionella]MCP0914317.1 cell division protein FtsL [Legionella sp. 27cVA30]RUQ89022.1 cell division protein FtsL [Legionella septentrionalis]RUR00329.1 cell division protein FtsL [Legionella septentrionalis]RUR11814.1 cell division protein FtsL [Legionella septentrionalis]RUR17502.1 cell division protein FtsL [Legionella septentrionalis]
MNAAAKLIHQSNFFSGQIADIRLSKQLYLPIFLLLSVLCSALAVVYTTNLYRMTFSQVEAAEQKTHQLQLQWGQLLLEQASLATPARVEQLAIDKLDMTLPANKQVFILRAK